MSKFMYLFRSNPAAYQNLTPEQHQQSSVLWKNWLEKLEKGGREVKTGDRLDWGGKVVRGKEELITDGPYVEVKDMIQGYMFFQAKDLDQAVELSRGCPLLAIGGSVEVRPFFEG
jgi:hypothetical protein